MAKRVILDFQNGVSTEITDSFIEFKKKGRLLFALDYGEMGELYKEMFGKTPSYENPDKDANSAKIQKEQVRTKEDAVAVEKLLSRRAEVTPNQDIILAGGQILKAGGNPAKSAGLLTRDGRASLSEPGRPAHRGYEEGIIDLGAKADELK